MVDRLLHRNYPKRISLYIFSDLKKDQGNFVGILKIRLGSYNKIAKKYYIWYMYRLKQCIINTFSTYITKHGYIAGKDLRIVMFYQMTGLSFYPPL